MKYETPKPHNLVLGPMGIAFIRPFDFGFKVGSNLILAKIVYQ
jgi:hypothetical protein